MPDRHDYTIVLEITPTAPLTHGAGNLGNEQQLMRREFAVQGEDGQWEARRIPAVSGAALKAQLREAAVTDAFESLGVRDGTVGLDALRLLLKGGKTASGGASVRLDEVRRMGELFPLLSVFGSMDGGAARPARIAVSDVLPYCETLVEAGLIPRVIRPVRSIGPGEYPNDTAGIAVYQDRTPIPDHMVETIVQYYAHDLRGARPSQRYLQSGATKELEDQREAVAAKRRAGESVGKDERRGAFGSMPHAHQAIRTGVPLVATIRLHGATEIELLCLARALTRWIASGGRLGGAGTKGHGACSVRVAGALRHRPEPGQLSTLPVDGLVSVERPAGDDPAAAKWAEYDAYLAERRDAILAELGVTQ